MSQIPGDLVARVSVCRSRWYRHDQVDEIEVSVHGFWRYTKVSDELRDRAVSPWYHPDTMPPYMLRAIRDQYLAALATGRVRDAGMVERPWFMARCVACNMALPFVAEADRDVWVYDHEHGTGHEVDTYREAR